MQPRKSKRTSKRSPKRTRSSKQSKPVAAPKFPSLAEETRALVPTDCAAYHLGRKPQTLRFWACRQIGPIQPREIYGRLGWSVAKLRRLTGSQ